MKDYTKNSALDWTNDTDITTITPGIIDKDKWLYVQEMGIMHAYPTFYTKRDSLPSYLLLYTEGGKVCLKYHNMEYHLSVGDFFFIDCMEYQYYYVESEENWDCRFVHIYGPNVIPRYYNTFVSNTGYAMHLPPHSQIPLYITQIIENYKPKHKNSDLLAAMHITQLLTEAVLNSENTSIQERANHIEEIAQYITDHFEQDLTLETLAQQFHVSRSYLPKQFKAQIGVTPNEYLCQVRIQASKELLRWTDMSIHDISQKIGISNASYYIKLFKKYENQTPQVFRNIWKINK